MNKWRIVVNNLQNDDVNKRKSCHELGLPVCRLNVERTGTGRRKTRRSNARTEDDWPRRNLLTSQDPSDDDDGERRSFPWRREVVLMTSFLPSSSDDENNCRFCRGKDHRNSPYLDLDLDLGGKDSGGGGSVHRMNCAASLEGRSDSLTGLTDLEPPAAAAAAIATGIPPSFACRDCAPFRLRRQRSPQDRLPSLTTTRSLTCSAPDILESSIGRNGKLPRRTALDDSGCHLTDAATDQ